MELKITNTLLKALNFRGDVELFKMLIANHSLSVESLELNKLEIELLNSRYTDTINDFQTYTQIAWKNRNSDCKNLPEAEQSAKRKLALCFIELPIISSILKILPNIVNLSFRNLEELKRFLTLLTTELHIYSYKEYALNYNQLNKDYFSKIPGLKEDITNLWKYLGFFDLFSYAFPNQPKNIRNLNLSELNLSARTYNAIYWYYGDLSLEKILFFHEKDFMEIRNFGEKSYIEVLNKMHSFDLNFFFESEGIFIKDMNNSTFKELKNVQKYYRLTQEKEALEKRLLQINKELEALEEKKKSI